MVTLQSITTRPLRMAVLLALLLPAALMAQQMPIPNPDFESGDAEPDGWRLEGGEGAWMDMALEGDRAITVRGDGTDQGASFWVSDKIDFKPSTAYQLQFEAMMLEGSGGSLFTGPIFNNRSMPVSSDAWQTFQTNFMTPNQIADEASRLRFGQWDINGLLAFDNIQLMELVPVYRRFEDMILGAGESIEGNRYAFDASFHTDSMNLTRPLEAFDCYFNQPRWVFAAGDWVVYRHRVGELQQLDGALAINIGYYTGGELAVEVGENGAEWTPLSHIAGMGRHTLSIPEDFFPSDVLWVRLRQAAPDRAGQVADVGGAIQVYEYHYTATLEEAPGNRVGATHFVTQPDTARELEVDLQDFGNGVPGENVLRFTVENTDNLPVTVAPYVTVRINDGELARFNSTPIQLFPNKPQDFQLKYHIADIGEVRLRLALDARLNYRAETTFSISPLHANQYGALLPDSTEDVALWWASSGWKISQGRPAPQETAAAVRIQAARNEREAAQVVLRPTQRLSGLQVRVEDLREASGAVLPASAIETFLVDYVSVQLPTDELGAVADWPDPLPLLDTPLELAADQNQPFWVQAAIPKDTPAGIYRGVLHFEAEGWNAEAPLEIEVFDFTLPDEMHCQSAFGFDASLVQRYHGLETGAERDMVAAKYMEMLSAHHISPYELSGNMLYPRLEYHWPHVTAWSAGERIGMEDATSGGALYLDDGSTTRAVQATYGKRFDVPATGLRVSMRHRSDEAEHPFIFVLMYYDEAGNWIPQRNTLVEVGSGTDWRTLERVVDDFPEEAAQFVFELQPTRYTDDGSNTGRVWIDTIELTALDTQTHLIADNFMPYTEAEIAERFTPEFDWESWDAAMEALLDRYHFNSFVIQTPGLGSGAGWAQHEPIPGNILGYPKGTPEYHAAFTAWYQEVQEHLREKGWLEKAFIYWFDEPEPKDYDFVMEYNQLLKEVAPDLQRKLTEEIHEELIGGPNLWCPISYEYDHEAAEARRAEGERIWWYICTAPKAPYATLFIDHPGTELRVWLWQTWQRDIEGILIWSLNWWTSNAAYPDGLQNPYEDPMSWVHILGDLITEGARAPWGNGDGRFLYPPKAAASGEAMSPVLEGPVATIRLNMLRDGIEDYEYLAMLDRLITAHEAALDEATLAQYRGLLEVPESITSAIDQFTWDPAPMEAHREAVARAIEALKRR